MGIVPDTIIPVMYSKKIAIVALSLLLPAPIIGIWASLNLDSAGQIIWTVMKFWLIVMPVLWLLTVEKGKISWSKSSMKGLIEGAFWAIPVGAVIWLLYTFCLESYVDKEGIRFQIELVGFDGSFISFWSFALMISFGNALMEEYVWRWFVFAKCKTLAGPFLGILLAAFFFTAHHIIVLVKRADKEREGKTIELHKDSNVDWNHPPEGWVHHIMFEPKGAQKSLRHLLDHMATGCKMGDKCPECQQAKARQAKKFKLENAGDQIPKGSPLSAPRFYQCRFKRNSYCHAPGRD